MQTVYPSTAEFSFRVHSYYARLMAHTGEQQEVEPSLGGKLLYVEDLDQDGRALAIAANVAGAASLSASSDPVSQRNALRDGVVDFLVTNLDEALRILKNEIRKGQAVAVCIAAAPEEIESQMRDRGVLPDILRPAAALQLRASTDRALVVWEVPASSARCMAKLDSMAVECAAEQARGVQRWLRLAPRYLGRLAQSAHVVDADREFAIGFVERLNFVEEFETPVRVHVIHADGIDEHYYGRTAGLEA